MDFLWSPLSFFEKMKNGFIKMGLLDSSPDVLTVIVI